MRLRAQGGDGSSSGMEANLLLDLDDDDDGWDFGWWGSYFFQVHTRTITTNSVKLQCMESSGC